MTILAPIRPTELTSRKPTMEDVRRGCGRFEYLDIRSAEILHTIGAGEGWVMVIGHPADASYEWVYVQCSGKCYVGPPYHVARRQADEEWSHSNAGWGSVAGALLDVLLRVEGASCTHCGCWMPWEKTDIRCPRCAE